MTSGERSEATKRRLLGMEGTVPTGAWSRLWRGGRGALGVGAALLRDRMGGEGGEALDEETLVELTRRLGELKGVAMKAGQILGYVDTSLPPALRQALSALQTAAPATPLSEVQAVVRAALPAESAEALLAGMEPAPVAVASIGQVHRARLPDGSLVAVKVRHPGIERAMEADFRAARTGGSLALLTAAGAAVKGCIDEARTALLEECDFALEARRQRRFGELLADDPVLVVPEVIEPLSAAAVLTTRYRPGLGLERFLDGDPSQARRDAAGEALFRFFVRTVYRDGLFHGDPHPGNFAFTDDGRVVVYDYGCVRELTRALRRGVAGLAAAVRSDDVDAMAEAVSCLGGRPPRDSAGRAVLRRLLRGFFGPLLPERGVPARRRIRLDEGTEARQLLADKRAVLGLELPPRLLFLFRLRFGLYAVLARLGAECDWSQLERAWAEEACAAPGS